MVYDPHDTIAAVATAPGGAARGIVRVSGAEAVRIVSEYFEPAEGKPLSGHIRAAVIAGCVRVEPDGGAPLMMLCDLFLWPTDRSYTREPVAELHTIGSPPLQEALVAALCRAGARLAEPGEFTLRAFLAGRIDLTQAEAVLGVIDAREQSELDGALAQLAGNLARPLHAMRDELVQLLAELEAGLDFVEEDIEFISAEELLGRLLAASEAVSAIGAQMASRGTATVLGQVALVGPPNVGKSSLFNAMLERFGTGGNTADARPRAIVSEQSGTTRDYLVATIDLQGVRCELIDTAGLERVGVDAAGDETIGNHTWTTSIAAAAQAMTAERRARASVRAFCVESGDESTHALAELAAVGLEAGDVLVLTKSDLAAAVPMSDGDMPADVPVVATSSVAGAGLDALGEALRERLTQESTAVRGAVVATTAERSRESLRLASAALGRATELVTAGDGEELVAAELRAALHELGKVVGAIYTDDLLDRIFSTFCIGK